VLYHIM